MNYVLICKQEPVFIFTKSLNQNPNIETSDETQSIEKYENSTVFLVIRCYQNKKTILICFSQGAVKILSIFTIYLTAIFIHQKILFVKNLK